MSSDVDTSSGKPLVIGRKRALYVSPVGEDGKQRLARIIQYDDAKFVEPEFLRCTLSHVPRSEKVVLGDLV